MRFFQQLEIGKMILTKYTLGTKLVIITSLLTLFGCQSLEVKKQSKVTITDKTTTEQNTVKTIIINAGKENEVMVKTLPADDTSLTELKPVQISPMDDPNENIWNLLPELYLFSNLNNPAIEKETKFYLKQADHFDSITEKAKPFLYFIFNEVKKRKLPGELVLLPIVESAFNTYAFSHGRAAGIWQ